jgi:hypothetical protein
MTTTISGQAWRPSAGREIALLLRCHPKPTRELRRYCCDGGVRKWHTASFRRAAELGRYRGMADVEQAIRPADSCFTTWLKITSHSIAVIEVLLTIVISHVFLFA